MPVPENIMKSATRHTMLLMGLVGLWASAFAAGHDPAKGGKFASMDSDGDGQVSAAEHVAGAKKMFTDMDSDMDGQVSAAEMDAARHDKAGAKPAMSSADKIKKLDTDGDGRLSASEHAAGSDKMFKAGDSNGDGQLTSAEMQAVHDREMAQK
ncbi:hypothetical protein GCM10007235_16340 [Pseudoxanthomonas indica]|nr:hypothetical protein GCM10007235_16340 [Pseudoxanthomonas indica]